MDFSSNYKELLQQMNFNVNTGKLKHNINKNSPLLPFKSREPERVVFDSGFYNILGEFSRILLNKSMERDIELNSIITNVINEDIDVEEGSDEYLVKLLKEYLFNEKNELKLLDPYLFLYIPLSNNLRSKGEKDIALFFRDIFCSDDSSLINFFSNNESDHAIINLLLKNISSLSNYKTEKKFIPLLDDIVDLFNEDINFAIRNEKFLIDNIDNIFAYYYFFYVSQLILKISKGFNADDNIDDLYYLLEWESASKNRKSLNKGYKFLKDRSNSLFAKMSVIDQVNTLMGTKGYLESDMLKFYNDLDEESGKNLLYYLSLWVESYRRARHFDYKELPNDFEGLVNILFESLDDPKNGIDQAPKSRYAKNIEEISKKYVIKRRGSYGYVLNMNRDMLLVITALCVKDKKIKLNQLFDEYERRGIYFDRYSKEEIVNFLTKLNLIDKKSDSGDAQYVKPVL